MCGGYDATTRFELCFRLFASFYAKPLPSRYDVDMKILTAKVVDGHLELPEGEVSEGAVVTVLVSDEWERFELSREEETRLLESIEQAKRGEVVDGLGGY